MCKSWIYYINTVFCFANTCISFVNTSFSLANTWVSWEIFVFLCKYWFHVGKCLFSLKNKGYVAKTCLYVANTSCFVNICFSLTNICLSVANTRLLFCKYMSRMQILFSCAHSCFSFWYLFYVAIIDCFFNSDWYYGNTCFIANACFMLIYLFSRVVIVLKYMFLMKILLSQLKKLAYRSKAGFTIANTGF